MNMHKIKPSGAKARILWEIKVNTVVADALAPCVEKYENFTKVIYGHFWFFTWMQINQEQHLFHKIFYLFLKNDTLSIIQ